MLGVRSILYSLLNNLKETYYQFLKFNSLFQFQFYLTRTTVHYIANPFKISILKKLRWRDITASAAAAAPEFSALSLYTVRIWRVGATVVGRVELNTTHILLRLVSSPLSTLLSRFCLSVLAIITEGGGFDRSLVSVGFLALCAFSLVVWKVLFRWYRFLSLFNLFTAVSGSLRLWRYFSKFFRTRH